MVPILSVKNLSVTFSMPSGKIDAVSDTSFDLIKGETLGVVGESGSGKSVTALSLMNLITIPGKITSGQIVFTSTKQNNVVDFLKLKDKEMCNYRGNEIAMIFQEPMSSLNPVVSCGKQITEAITLHKKTSFADAKNEAIMLMEKVKLSNGKKLFDAYPHQLSGGQKQRMMIAMAISCNPSILIADEPTTALDVTIQKSIIHLLKDLQQQTGMSIIFISHDLAVVSEVAHNIAVMRYGKIVEVNKAKSILENATHPYTKGLIGCKPPLQVKLRRLPVIEDFVSGVSSFPGDSNVIDNAEQKENNEQFAMQEPFLSVNNLSVIFNRKSGLLDFGSSAFHAVENVSFQLKKGEVLGIAGESGSGKTTLGKAVLQLIKPKSGSVIFQNQELSNLSEKEMRSLRKKMQVVFQDPYSSLNPKMKVGDAVAEAISFHKIAEGKTEVLKATQELFDKVGLSGEYYHRYPNQLSGGQRQRVAIARALAVKPELLICDECVSALDVSVQATILNLFMQLKEEMQLTMLFISHDLSVLRFMCDRILVMQNGKVVEEGTAEQILNNPQSGYTKSLIEAVPVLKA